MVPIARGHAPQTDVPRPLRVSLFNVHMITEDAVGRNVLDQALFFRRRGDHVRIYCQFVPPDASPATVELSRVVDLASVADEHFLGSNLYIFHYPSRYALMDAIKEIDHGAVLLHYHNVTPPEFWDAEDDRDILRRSLAGVRELTPFSDLVVTPSAFNASQLVAEHGCPSERVHVLPLAVPLDRFNPGPRDEALVERYDLQRRRVVLFVGRMAGNKRVDLLVEALPLVRRHVPDASLMLVGDNASHASFIENVARLKARARDLDIADHVIVTGKIADLPSHYRLADVYATASLHEGFGVPLIEAMACGVPVVASRATAHPWVLQGAGLLADPGDPVDLARQIVRAMTEETLRADLIRRGIARALKCSMEGYESGLDRVVSEGTGHGTETSQTRTTTLAATSDMTVGRDSVAAGREAATGVTRSPFWRTAALLVAASTLYCAPLFLRLDHWGREDWDQFTFRYDTPRVALLRDHVLPTWNPYSNGGTVLLAHPDSPVASPWYLIVLALGAPVGLRVQVLVFMAAGAVGMAALLARLGTSRLASIAGGLVFMMSSHFALHITEGHLEWCVLGLMPWLAICLMRLEESLRYTILAALLLASVVTFGAVYIPAVYLPFFSVWIGLQAARERDWARVVHWANVVVLAAALASVKLLPMVQFTRDWPRDVPPGAGTPPRLLATGLFDPRQARLYQVSRDRDLADGHFAKVVDGARAAPMLGRLEALGAKEGFHEYSCYVGVAGVLLALLGLLRTGREQWPIYGAGASALLVVFGSSLPVDLWSAMHHLPFYGQLQVPSRFLAAVVFVLAIATAFGLDSAVRMLTRSAGPRQRVAGTAGAIIVLVLFAELGALGWTLFQDIFVVPPLALEAHDTFAQRFTERSLVPRVMSSTMHPYLISNSGTLDAYENLSVARGNVHVTGDAAYRGEAYLESSGEPVRILRWTMSAFGVEVVAAAPDRLVINQNFYRGWQARRRGPQGVEDLIEAESTDDGLIAVPVDSEHTEIEVFYVPNDLLAGASLSGISLAMCLAGLWFTRRRSLTLTPGAPR